MSAARLVPRRGLLAASLAGLLTGLAWSGLVGAQTPGADAPPTLADGDVLLFRHAIAPGGGDPPGWRLGDCSTQRNLDDSGRQQAQRIGTVLRARGLRIAALWVSPWCRTRETAALAFPGQALLEQAAFASFFGEPARGEAQTREARALLRHWQASRSARGQLVVVTHQVNITALTGIHPASGEGVLLRWGPDGWLVAGRIAAP